MGKILWFAFALFALQGSYASLGSPRNALDDLFGEYLGAQSDANQIISFIDTHLLPVLQNFEKLIVGVTQDKEISSTLQELEETIKNLEPENDSKNCVDKALRLEMTAKSDVEREIKLCTNIARIAEDKLQNVVEDLKARASDVGVRVITGMHNCLIEGDGITDENVKCLKELIVVLKNELTELAKDKDEIHYQVHKVSEKEVEELNKCVQSVKEDLEQKSVTILEQLQDCLQSNSTAVKTYQKGIILQIFKDLKHKINSIINIITNLPTSIDQIPDKIQDVISHINIATITNQVETEIDEIIAGAGRDAEKCRLGAENRLLVIKNTSKKEVKASMETAHEKIALLRSEIHDFASKTFTEANTLLATLNKHFMTCYLEHILNPAHLKKCLLSFYVQLKQNASDLNDKVSNYVDDVKVSTDKIIKELAQRVNEIQVKTVTEGQTLIADIEKCVWTAS